MLDLGRQGKGIVPITQGGTGNNRALAAGVLTLWSYFPADYSSGGVAVLPAGSLVRLSGAAPLVRATAGPDDRALGVALGPYDLVTGLIDYGADTDAGATIAVAHVGVVDVRFAADATQGQFVSPSPTAGGAQGSDGMRLNAVGQLLTDVAAGALAPVLLVNALGSLSAGISGDIRPSSFGDPESPGSVGLMADAGHRHAREPDASAIRPDSAASADASYDGAHLPARAIDGDDATFWESADDFVGAHWWQVDLASPRFIIRGYLHMTRGALSLLESSADGSAWTAAPFVITASLDADTQVWFDVVTPTLARYWRFHRGAGFAMDAWQIRTVDLRTVPYAPLGDDGLIPGEYLPTSGGGGASALDDLTDVDAPAPTDGQALAWDAGASAWTPQTLSGIVGGSGGPPGGVELHGSAQSGMTNSTPLVWNDPAIFDPDGYWDNATPTRLTVPSGQGGRLFHLYAGGEFVDPSNNPIKMRQNIYLNGAPFALGQIDFQQYISYVSALLLLQDGDYIEVQPYRQDGTDWKLIVNDMLPRLALAPVGIPGADGAPGTDGTDGADGAPGADGLGVPAGGSTGQVLTKVSGADNDTAWEASTGSGGGASEWPLGDRRRKPASPNAKDDEFDGMSSVAWTNFGTWNTQTINTTRPDHLYAQASGSGSTLCGIVQAIPATPFDIYALVDGANHRQNYQRGGGIVLFPSGAIGPGSTPVYCGLVYNSDHRLARIRYSSLSGYGDQSELAGQGKHECSYLWVHVIDTTHLDFSWSTDGWSWVPVQVGYTVPFTIAQMGLGTSEEASGGVDAYFDFLRIG